MSTACTCSPAGAQENSRQAGPIIRETLQDFIYRRFFKAAIAIVLTLGCSWGAINLYEIGLRKSFLQTGLLAQIHAHAHAMIFGWVGLFVMGFAYQSFPRFKYASLWKPRLANLTLFLMLIGIASGVAAELLQPATAGLALGALSGVAEFAAIGLFCLIIYKSMKNTVGPRYAWEKFLYAGMFWFLVQAVLSCVFFFAKATAINQKELIWRIATIDGPLRDIQLLGFVAMMIAGVSLRMIPMAYGMPRPQRDRQSLIFWLMNGSLVLGVASYLLTLRGSLWFAIGLELAYILQFAWGILLVRQLGVFRKPQQSDRSLKFIRAAYAWMLLALAMMPFFIVYGILTHQGFAHSYMGAHRHAFTVGFISMMILGVSSRIVPMLAGVEPARLSSLWGPFLLFNFGNAARVLLQILTDFVPNIAFRLVGISGFVEVIALAWWGTQLWRTMNLADTERAKLFRPVALASR